MPICYECQKVHDGPCSGYELFGRTPMQRSTYLESDGTPVTKCPACGKWCRPSDEHDYEACEAARDEAADHKRRERIEDERTDDDYRI